MISPKKNFLILFSVFFILGLSNWILPLKIPITDTFFLSNFNLKGFFVPPQIQYTDINKIKQRIIKDSIQLIEPENKEIVLIPRDSILDIQFPVNGDTLLDDFFTSLKHLEDKSNQHFRVLHFGDSQIEGDRITGVLRNLFQEKFGGCGTGILHLTDPMKVRHSHQISGNEDWEKKAAYGPNSRNKSNKYFGILASFFEADTLYDQAIIKVKKTYQARKNEAKAEEIRLLYINKGDSITQITQNNKPLKCKEFDNFLAVYQLENNTSDNIEVKLEEENHKIAYGVSFDCEQGITFDNVPMRGSSGTEFTKLNPFLISLQLRKLNTKLIIFQFGVNVVPYIQNNYSFYEELFLKQLMFFKKNVPEIPILVIGVSDMSRKVGENYESFPNITMIRDAQKNAAFKAGCAFWDLYENMGGQNSMPSWVDANPPLASKDYTHFTNAGANYVGKMLYKSLINEYERKKH